MRAMGDPMPSTRRARAMSRAVVLLALLGLLLSTQVAFAAAGDLDPSFGTGGWAVYDLDRALGPNAVAVQPDGKLIVSGAAFNGGAKDEVFVARFTAAGLPDPSFGVGGSVFLPSFDYVWTETGGTVIQPDGGILVVGTAQSKLSVARLLPDGSLDASFGVGGIASVGAEGTSNGHDLALQRDGRIIAVGRSSGDFFAARFLSDGIPDWSFSSGGWLHLDIPTINGATSVEVQRDGRIVLAGGQEDFVLARLLQDGSLDASFGDEGVARMDFGADVGMLKDIALQAGRGILAVGHLLIDAGDDGPTIVARYRSDGVLDRRFGDDGVVRMQVCDFSTGSFVGFDRGGRIVVVGYLGYDPPAVNQYDFMAFRLSPRGEPDPTFGEGGVTVFDLGVVDGIFGATVLPGGRAVIGVGPAGEVNGGAHDLAIVKYLLH